MAGHASIVGLALAVLSTVWVPTFAMRAEGESLHANLLGVIWLFSLCACVIVAVVRSQGRKQVVQYSRN